MLNPRSRHVYLEALKAPGGFALDHAVGTTFSLDLQTLLAVPLGFAVLDWENAKGELSLDPVTLLHALRRCADRVTIFCQEGRIAAPTKHHPLFAHLEPMIAEVHAPDESGIFHAKTWLLRFTGDEGVLYRFVCLSRNLTRDRSWDTVLALDGVLAGRERAFSRNHPLGEFIAALPSLARREPTPARREALAVLADEVRRVKFELPEGFEEVTFWPVGLLGTRKFPLNDRMDRLLVVSPFVLDGFLRRLLELAPTTLVSRPESLEEVAPEVLKRFAAVHVLDDEAVEEDADDESTEGAVENLGQADVRGQHAKLFVADQGWYASVWTGSANATEAAFEKNVEFLVQLRGKKKRGNVGIDAFLGDDENGGGFRDLLRPFQVGERKAADPGVKENEERVETARRRLARATFRLRVETSRERSGYDMALCLAGTEHLDIGEAQARCWPVTLNPSFARDVAVVAREGSVQFPNLTVHALTSFVTFEVAAGDGPKRVVARFALNLPLDGVPEDRLEQVLNAVLGDRERLLRYLLFLLARDDDVAAVGPGLLAENGGAATGGGGPDLGAVLPLFEELVRAVARSPEKIDAVGRLVGDLRKTPEGAALLPEGFEEVWKPVWAARLARKEARR